MAWPPVTPPNSRLNTTPTVDNHPADHNLIADALTEIVNVLGTDPAGDFTDIQDRLEALEFSLRPPGELMHFGGSAKPDGRWLPSNGGEYPRGAPYDRLFSAIGVLWGAGNGSSTFNVPNLAGYTLVGAGAAGWPLTVGTRYGTKDATLVKHSHGPGTHNHGVNIWSSYYDVNHLHTFTTAANGQHYHGINGGTQLTYEPGGSGYGFTLASPGTYTIPLPAVAWNGDGNHQHVGTTDAMDRTGNHRHAINGMTDQQGQTGRTAEEGPHAGIDSNYQPSANCTVWVRY